MKSWLPAGQENKFQVVKALRAAREEKGLPCINLGIGQPMCEALESARLMASAIIAKGGVKVDSYQDNGCEPCPDFALRFVQSQVRKIDLKAFGDQLGYLPIPGIKPTLGAVIRACGLGMKPNVGTMTHPGYPTPADWCDYLQVDHAPIDADDSTKFLPDKIDERHNLLMFNFPHNPSGQVTTKEYWEWRCQRCVDRGTRLFNDAAYATLQFSPDSCLLSEVAPSFNVSWAEAFSASKVGNGCGYRVGAIVGSADFIADIATIKGNMDSGFNAGLAIGALHALEEDQQGVQAVTQMYQRRLQVLDAILREAGMKYATGEPPGGTFFVLCEHPKVAFGQNIEDAKAFNALMIEQTGLIGIPFGIPGYDKYIRYTTCNDVEKLSDQIRTAFVSANVSY